MIGGVCAGLAEYFNVDPTIIRLIFVFLTLAGFSGVLIYLIMLLVIPAK
jgi:phage shock protein C